MLKEIGVLCVIAGASAVGFGFAGNIRRQLRQTAALAEAMTFLKNEITYRRTPLPQIFPLLAASASEPAVSTFWGLCGRLMCAERQRSVSSVFRAALEKTPGLTVSAETRQTLLTLGTSLGQFDLEGQNRALELAAARLEAQLHRLEQGSTARRRSYITIGICAGMAAAVILL